MKTWLISLMTVFVMLAAPVQANPEYEKWGAIAVKEAQKRYRADIIDYRHLGRIERTPNESEERFKLWVRNKEGREFGVYVFIRFDPSTDAIHSIRFSESER
ncbi:DUF3889 domain-containing protein [Paenibacillus sp. FSL M7-1455]|uniref:DUF3889 domain-containing protein n=1 Tax=Paenibacillus cookii TaxID=157839 RepID=A0ABQ4LRV0_9BACL|nr:DUF3889 domain-containing protein [Paenibacillus cookii]GIO66000.1 hypothetical protein J21TS3_08210 [Paenibacillus cookii]